MASSTTEISNLALGHLGIGKEISNIDTDRSSEAITCKRFLPTAIDQVLRDYPWSFANQIVVLSLVATQPNQEWNYSYRAPSDCITFSRILSGLRSDYRESRVSFKIGQDSSGLLIFTDMINAQLEYTQRVSNPLFWPADFTMALSLYLAALIAPSVTAGDPFKNKTAAMNSYDIFISQAKANAANEDQPDVDPDGEFIRGRN